MPGSGGSRRLAVLADSPQCGDILSQGCDPVPRRQTIREALSREMETVKPLLGLLLLVVATGSQSATLLVGNKSAASVSLIDLERGVEVARAHEVAVSGDGRLAVVTNYGRETPGNTLSVIEVEQGRTVGTIDLGDYTRPHGIVFMPDNQHVLVTAEGARSLLQVDVWAGRVVKAVPTGQITSHMLAYDAAGRRAYVANMGSGSVSLISPPIGLLSFRASGRGAEGIALSPDRRELWVTNRDEDTVSRFDTRDLELMEKVSVAGFPIRAETLPDGRVLVSSARSATLSVIDPAGGAEGGAGVVESVDINLGGGADTVLGDTGGSSVPIGIEIAPDGGRVWIAHAAVDAVQELEVGSWRQLRLLKTGDEPDAMGYSPRRVAGASGVRR